MCDGRVDCPYREDEDDCEHYSCPLMLKCKDSQICVHPIEVCDGVIQCPHGDDEAMCGVNPCPQSCTCLGRAIRCVETTYTRIPNSVNKYTKYLSMASSRLNTNGVILHDYSELITFSFKINVFNSS